ncbi:MAG: 16S rRNA processing protein RimM [Firmicutes bacterium]|nr:16S rRNA processing protein RimM [Bacillota bacterium]
MEEFITVGQITGPFGCRGKVKVTPYTDFPERFLATKRIFLRLADLCLEKEVESAVLQKNRVILKLSTINTPEEAKKFQGALLQVPRAEVWPLPEGRYYHFQLLGFSVFTEDGELVGKVAEILTTGSNDVYVIKDSKKGKEYLIPAIKDVVKKINLEEKSILIHPLPGLLGE